MLPEKAAGWPIGGEIDIMEHVGHRPGVVHGSIHTEAYNHVKGTQSTATRQVADACDAFHRYQVRWTPDEILFLIDDQPFHRFANDQARDVETWPFDKPFHLILNVAVGGTWGGEEGVDDAVFPQRMEVDYVRVYQPAD
jgi:beta-glucanase (GH16 family)